MLEFVSRKIPLGEHRQLSYMATLFARAWQDGHNEGNELLQSWASRGLMFCEQVALDSGRCQLGWMLTGLQPPDFHLLAQHKRRAHVQPFSTLAKPTWAAACLSYLKEMSYLEGRMNSGPLAVDTRRAPRRGERLRPPPLPQSQGKSQVWRHRREVMPTTASIPSLAPSALPRPSGGFIKLYHKVSERAELVRGASQQRRVPVCMLLREPREAEAPDPSLSGPRRLWFPARRLARLKGFNCTQLSSEGL